jgi:hypothetical protein
MLSLTLYVVKHGLANGITGTDIEEGADWCEVVDACTSYLRRKHIWTIARAAITASHL